MKLADQFSVEDIHAALLPPGRWHPYPTITERAQWTSLPADEKQRLVADGEALLGASWPALPATLYMEFARNGNRSRYEAESFARRMMLIRLVLAECVEHQGRFLDDIVNGIWAICEESFWDVPAHNYYTRYPDSALPDTEFPVVALFSAETGSALAYTGYLLDDVLRNRFPIVAGRIPREIRNRLLDPYIDRDDWLWLGFEREPGDRAPNNWNPWIHSNLLAMEMLIERDEARRAEFFHRALRGLDLFLSGYHDDGGCDEGITYWGRAGASVFDCLDVLDSGSNGNITVWDQPLIQEMARYVYRAHIADNWYVNFADGTARSVPDANIIYHFGEKIGDEGMMAQGIVTAARHDEEHPGFLSFNRVLSRVFRPVPQPDSLPAYPLVKQSWLDGIQVLTARETEGSSDGLFVAAKGGHNGESHNHNDIGSFIVALDGQPVLIDAGVEEYTKKTFSPDRYDIWTMQSAYHNLPTINGMQQSPGAGFHASDVSAELADDHAALRLDIADAWSKDAGIERWTRTIRLDRGADACISISDNYALTDDPESIVLTLMAASGVDVSRPGELRLEGPKRPLLVDYDADLWRVETERIPIDDARMTPVWCDSITRILLHARAPTRTGIFHLNVHAVTQGKFPETHRTP